MTVTAGSRSGSVGAAGHGHARGRRARVRDGRARRRAWLGVMLDTADCRARSLLSRCSSGVTGSAGPAASTSVGLAAAFRLRLPVPRCCSGYPAAFETLWRGRTLGKAALGLRVVTIEGAPVRFRHAAIRSMLGLFDKYPASARIIGVVTILGRAQPASGRPRGGHDRVAGATGGGGAVAVAVPRAGGPRRTWRRSTCRSSSTTTTAPSVRSCCGRRGCAGGPAERRPGGGLAGRAVAARRRRQGCRPRLFLVCVAAAYQARHCRRPWSPARSSPALGRSGRGRRRCRLRPGRRRRRRPMRAVRRPPPSRPSGRRVRGARLSRSLVGPCHSIAYLDHAATTPMRPEAVAAMLPYLTEHFGNPSGVARRRPRRPGRAGRGPRRRRRRASGASRARSCSPAAAPRPTTWPCSASSRRPAAASVCIGGRAPRRAARRRARRRRGSSPVGADGVVDLDALAARARPTTSPSCR